VIEATWLNDVNAKTYHDDASLLPYTPAGTGAVARTVDAKLGEWVSVKDFGAVGDWNGSSGTDDYEAIQTFINYCRDNRVRGVFTKDGSSYRITQKLVTQHDGNYASLNIDFCNAQIIADFSDSAALEVRGGAAVQTLLNVNLMPSTAYAMAVDYSNKNGYSHGIAVYNTKVKITGDIGAFRGHGYLHFDTAANSNNCEWDLNISGCHFGAYFQGPASDNLSVCKASFRTGGCAGPGFYGESNAILREWNVWIYSENNCQDADYASLAAVYVLNAYASVWWIYSEQNNTSNDEIYFGAGTSSNMIRSARRNKDIDAGNYNSWQFGFSFYRPDTTRMATVHELYNEYSRVGYGTEYVQQQIVGSGGAFGFLRGQGNSSGSPWIKLLASGGTTELAVKDGLVQANDHLHSTKRLSSALDVPILASSQQSSFGVNLVVTTSGATANLFTLPSSTAGASALVFITCKASGGVTWSYIFYVFRSNSTFTATKLADGNSQSTATCTLQLSGSTVQAVFTYAGGLGGSFSTYSSGVTNSL